MLGEAMSNSWKRRRWSWFTFRSSKTVIYTMKKFYGGHGVGVSICRSLQTQPFLWRTVFFAKGSRVRIIGTPSGKSVCPFAAGCVTEGQGHYPWQQWVKGNVSVLRTPRWPIQATHVRTCWICVKATVAAGILMYDIAAGDARIKRIRIKTMMEKAGSGTPLTYREKTRF